MGQQPMLICNIFKKLTTPEECIIKCKLGQADGNCWSNNLLFPPQKTVADTELVIRAKDEVHKLLRSIGKDPGDFAFEKDWKKLATPDNSSASIGAKKGGKNGRSKS